MLTYFVLKAYGQTFPNVPCSAATTTEQNCDQLQATQLFPIIATTTANFFDFMKVVLPPLLVFAVIAGVLWMAIRWVKSIISGHGNRS